MTEDKITDAARRVASRRREVSVTTGALKRRMDPKLIAADVARLVLARAVSTATSVTTTPKRRKRAIVSAGIAAAAAIGFRMLYRNDAEKHSPEDKNGSNAPE